MTNLNIKIKFDKITGPYYVMLNGETCLELLSYEELCQTSIGEIIESVEEEL